MSNDSRYFRVGGAILHVEYGSYAENISATTPDWINQTYNGHDFAECGGPGTILTELGLEGQAITAAACAAAVLEIVEEWFHHHPGDDVCAVRDAAITLSVGGDMTERDWMEKANEVLGEYDISMTMGMSGRVDYWARRPDI